MTEQGMTVLCVYNSRERKSIPAIGDDSLIFDLATLEDAEYPEDFLALLKLIKALIKNKRRYGMIAYGRGCATALSALLHMRDHGYPFPCRLAFVDAECKTDKGGRADWDDPLANLVDADYFSFPNIWFFQCEQSSLSPDIKALIASINGTLQPISYKCDADLAGLLEKLFLP